MEDKLYKALDILSPDDRKFIEALYFLGKSEASIKDELNISQAVFNATKKRLLNTLRDYLCERKGE